MVKISIDGKEVALSDSSVLGKIYYQCDVPIDEVVNHPINNVISVAASSSWYSEGCQDAYASVSSINKYFYIYSDFQKPSITAFRVEGSWDNRGKRARIARGLSSGNKIYIWIRDPERSW
jgi:hypothetical protein